VKAGEGTMKQGYRDVGYLFAPYIRRFRPPAIPNYSWLRQVRALAAPVEAGNPAAVQQWFHAHYPVLMELIPAGLHQDFVAGVIERAAEIESGEARTSVKPNENRTLRHPHEYRAAKVPGCLEANHR